MPLTNQKIEQFRRSVQLALNQEWPELAKIRQRLASVVPRPINCDAPPGLPVIGTVATNGGENRVVLDPIRLHVIRVACSTGEIFCEDFVPLSLTAEEILRFFFPFKEAHFFPLFNLFYNLVAHPVGSWGPTIPGERDECLEIVHGAMTA